MNETPPPGTQRPDPPYDCLVVSDLHLGSAVCQARLLEGFLVWAAGNTRELVINGDIFDDLNFNRLTKRHFACLKVIRKNSDRDDFRIVWIRGNHDGPADTVGHIVGVTVRDEYVYRNDRLSLLILHGDQFDTFITRYKWLTEVSCGLFFVFQKWMPHGASRWVRRLTKRFQRNSQLVERRATDYARGKGLTAVTCGHTHLAMESRVNGVHYLNTGTWIEPPPCPFVSVRGGEVRLEFWPPHGPEGGEPGDRVEASPHPAAEEAGAVG